MKKANELSGVVIVSITIIIFSETLFACPPPNCGDCCHWDEYYERCVLDQNADCGDCAPCTGECETCENCQCQSKCADCMICVAGDCEDIQCKVILGECQRCNETTGECEYSCSDEGCGEICVDNECVPDCNSNGSTCDWTWPLIQSTCPYRNIDDPSCEPDVIGLTCSWIVVASFSHSATGPCKEPGGFCAMLEPVVCENTFIPFMGNQCGCTGTPDLVNYEYRTARYKCP